MTTLTLSDAQRVRRERILDAELDAFLDDQLKIVFSNADRVGPDARHKLRGILRHYAKYPHPFRQCVKDNTKRFGPGRVERVCAVVKDLIRGTTRWRGHPELDHGAPGAIAASCPVGLLDDDIVELLFSIPDDVREKLAANTITT